MSPLDEIRILEKQNRLRMSQVYSVPAHQLSDGLVFQGFIARALKDSQLTRQPPGERPACFGDRTVDLVDLRRGPAAKLYGKEF